MTLGVSMSISTSSSMPFSVALLTNNSMTPSKTSLSLKILFFSSNLPASILEKSNISLMIPSSA